MNYLKNRDDPVALKEEEYPEWLWRCLDKKVVVDELGDGEGDEFCAFSNSYLCYQDTPSVYRNPLSGYFVLDI